MSNYEDIREFSYEMTGEIKYIYSLFTSGAKFDLEKLDDLMKGAIDTHVHPAPDAYANRPFDDIELALQANEAKMGAVVFKCHSFPTARSAKLAQRIVSEQKDDSNINTKIVGGAIISD